jgi:hypothetical protein
VDRQTPWLYLIQFIKHIYIYIYILYSHKIAVLTTLHGFTVKRNVQVRWPPNLAGLVGFCATIIPVEGSNNRYLYSYE